MMSSGDAHGVIFDVDGCSRAAASSAGGFGRWHNLSPRSSFDAGLPRLVRALSADPGQGAPVVYLTAFPKVLPGR
jgi:hypothetical protein